MHTFKFAGRLAALVAALPIVVQGQLASSPTLTSTLGPVIDLGYAAYAGNATLTGVHFYGGIPYIQPPVGELRWRRPRRLDESKRAEGVTDARNWGPLCIQQPAVVGVGAEDCVTLNVWKPANATASSKLPVIVYIHGGGQFANSAQGFPMNNFVAHSGGQVVAVNIQYRLGLLGFLASKAVTNDGNVNAGLLDQQEALAWIQRHIAKFGGDPNKVTISGESAGGASVVYHMTAYGATRPPLFRGVIAQSIGTDPTPKPEQYEACFSAAATNMGCEPASPKVMPCLRKASLGAIVSAIRNRGTCKFLPVVDGDLIPDLPSRMLSSGKIHKVAFIGGHTTDDGSTFVGTPESVTTTEQFVRALTARYTFMSNETAQRMIELYPEASFTSQWERAKVAFGDTVFTCQDWYIAQKLFSLGSKDAYNYRWHAADPVRYASQPYKGVQHTSDLYYLFDGTNSGPSASVAQPVFNPFTPTERSLAIESVRLWTNFARDLNPSDQSTSPTIWGDVSQGRLVFQLGNSTSTGTSMEQRDPIYEKRCLFWNEVGAEIRL